MFDELPEDVPRRERHRDASRDERYRDKPHDIERTRDIERPRDIERTREERYGDKSREEKSQKMRAKSPSVPKEETKSGNGAQFQQGNLKLFLFD